METTQKVSINVQYLYAIHMCLYLPYSLLTELKIEKHHLQAFQPLSYYHYIIIPMIRSHVKLIILYFFIIITIKKQAKKTKTIVSVLQFVSKIMQIKNSNTDMISDLLPAPIYQTASSLTITATDPVVTQMLQ